MYLYVYLLYKKVFISALKLAGKLEGINYKIRQES